MQETNGHLTLEEPRVDRRGPLEETLGVIRLLAGDIGPRQPVLRG